MSSIPRLVADIYRSLEAAGWTEDALETARRRYGSPPVAAAEFARTVRTTSVFPFTADVKLVSGERVSVSGYTHAALLAIKETP
jgi:hypothetical protein